MGLGEGCTVLHPPFLPSGLKERYLLLSHGHTQMCVCTSWLTSSQVKCALEPSGARSFMECADSLPPLSWLISPYTIMYSRSFFFLLQFYALSSHLCRF